MAQLLRVFGFGGVLPWGPLRPPPPPLGQILGTCLTQGTRSAGSGQKVTANDPRPVESSCNFSAQDQRSIESSSELCRRDPRSTATRFLTLNPVDAGSWMFYHCTCQVLTSVSASQGPVLRGYPLNGRIAQNKTLSVTSST